jgi:argininosuccinate synthase
MNRVLFACSGSARSLSAIEGLVTTHAEVVTVTVDLGHQRDLIAAHKQALATGAVRAHVIESREEFARTYLMPALQAGALSPHGTSVIRGLMFAAIAEQTTRVADLEGASVVAHACRTEADGRLFEKPLKALNARVKIVSATPAWEPPDSRPRSADVRPVRVPDTPACVEVTFVKGAPIAVNGVEMPLTELLQSLDTLAGSHGVARESADDSPALAVLHAAHAGLWGTSELAGRYAALVTQGDWWSPAREALDRLVSTTVDRRSGIASVKLFNGSCEVVDSRAVAI